MKFLFLVTTNVTFVTSASADATLNVTTSAKVTAQLNVLFVADVTTVLAQRATVTQIVSANAKTSVQNATNVLKMVLATSATNSAIA
jgi:hypothetical protein